MNILVEGPRWCGLWTEIVADALRRSGHRVGISYHNHKRARDRIALAGTGLLGRDVRNRAWRQRHRQQLVDRVRAMQPDLLFSIQGPLDADTVARLRREVPRLKIVYWWGDILTADARLRIEAAAGFADLVLVSYRGTCDTFKPRLGDRLVWFPFGISPAFHRVAAVTASERKRFAADVAFVGTCYPERGALIRYLNRRLDTPVAVWGRGWRMCRGIPHHGTLSLSDSLKVHHCARISLNLHHVDTPDGCNMKFFEIPAAGGFQICDWQPVMETTKLGRETVSCHSPRGFAQQVGYYLAHEEERRQRAAANQHTVLTTTDYPSRLEAIIKNIVL